MNLSTYYLLGFALGPVVVLITFVYFNDKHEKEPIKLLLICFLLGCFSVIPAILLEILAEKMGLTENPSSLFRTFLVAFIGVALMEEFSKFIFLRGFIFRHKEFNEPYDGIMYMMMIGMGFAMVENLIYVFSQETYEAQVHVAQIRALSAVPAHGTFAIIMGYFAGKANFDRKNSFGLLLLGILAATFFHGAYDFFLMQGVYPAIVAGAFVSLIIGIVLSIKAIKIHKRNSPFQ